jgi:transcription initiation factor TFIID TATA-box-binding protein
VVLVGFHIKIENVVASANLHADIKLEKVVANLEGIEYEPEQFPGVVMRLKDPKAAALIFSSGKIVCTGAKSPGDAKLVVNKIVTKLRKLGIKIPRDHSLRLENIVASAKLEQELNLDDIAFTLENTEYEPEQFPGLVYRMDDPKVTFLLFGSGKIICTGGRSIRDVERAVEKLDKRLRHLKKKK